jgi:SanA protein
MFKLETKYIVFAAILIIVILLLIPAFIQIHSTRSIYKSINDIPKQNVAIVFGAGLNTNRTPSDMLVDRLETAAEIYKAGKVSKILVSGDNRFENYDEPTAMSNKLINDFKIPKEDIVLDYAGRRTYDTCKRAKEIFSIDKALVITQEYHLYRAIYTCESLGIESYGYSATRHRYVGDEGFYMREFLAQYKAVLDIYFIRPDAVGGPKEVDL